MPDDTMQQLTQPATVGGIGGIVGIILGLVGASNASYVKRSEMETAIANVKLQGENALNSYKVEVAEKYITRESLKELMRPIEENLEYVRDCVDALRDQREKKES